MNGDTQALIIALYEKQKLFGTIRLTTIACSSAELVSPTGIDGLRKKVHLSRNRR